MADIDELYSDVFQIPHASAKRTPVKKKSHRLLKPFRRSAAVEKSVDENSVDIYSDMSLDGNSPYKMTPTKSNSSQMPEDHIQSLNDNLDLYTEVMTSELTEKSNQELDRLRSENQKLLAENQKLNSLKDQLNKNISSLFLTAKKELQKKDEEIKALRKLIEEQNESSGDKTRAAPISKVIEVKQTSSQNSSHKDDRLDKRKLSCLDKARRGRDSGGSARDSVSQGIKRKCQDSCVEAEMSRACVEPPPVKKNKVAESVEPSEGGLSKVVFNAASNKVVSETVNQVISKTASNTAVSNRASNKAASLETACKLLLETTNKISFNSTSNKVVSETANKVLSNSNATSNNVVSKTANKVVSETANKVVPETANKVVSNSNSTSNKVVSETANKAVSETANRVVSETANKVVSNSNSTSNKVVSETANKVVSETANKVVSNSNSTSNKVVSENANKVVSETANKVVSETANKVVSETANKVVSETANKVVSNSNTTSNKFVSLTANKVVSNSNTTSNKFVSLTANKVVSNSNATSNKVVSETANNIVSNSNATANKAVSNTASFNKFVSEPANKVVSSVTANKVVSETANKVISNATSNNVVSETANKVISNATSNNVVSETANKVISNATSNNVVSETVNKVISNATSNNVVSETANKVISNATSNNVVSETANKVISNATSNNVVSETANKVISNATSNNVVSETAHKVVSNATSNRAVSNSASSNKFLSEPAKKVLSKPAHKVVSNETSNKIESNTTDKKAVFDGTSYKIVLNQTFNKNVSETAKKVVFNQKANKVVSKTANKVVSNQTFNKAAANEMCNKIGGMNAASNRGPTETCNKMSVLNASNKSSSTEACNNVSAINETSSSSFTNQTWPFQVTSNFHFENSKDASDDVGDPNVRLAPKSKTDRAFPIDKVSEASPESHGPQNLSSSFVDIEEVDNEEESDWNDNGNQNRTLISLADVRKRVCTQSGIVPADDMIASNRVQLRLPGGNCPEDSEPKSPSPLPFSTFAAGKAKGKSDDSNDSEKASSNSSAVYTDSDKLSLSSEEFPKEKETRPLESPVPFATSITCASNLILLGDEETTCTMFISPCKPSYLPSEFYPPGARAPVQVEASHARHIRGPPEVIQKPRVGLPHKDSHTSFTLGGTKPEGFTSQLDVPSKGSGSMDILKEQLVDATGKLQNIQAGGYPVAKKHLEYLTENTLNTWTSLVEQKFYQVFHKELKIFKEGNVLISQAASRLAERRKARLLEKKRDWIRRGREQGQASNSVGNSYALPNTTQDKSTIFSCTVLECRDTVNQAVHEAELESLAKDPKTVSSKTGNETFERVLTADITKTPNIGPHLVGPVRNSPDSWMVTSSDYQNNANVPVKPDAGQERVSTVEPDSTCEYQNNTLSEANVSKHSTSGEDLVRENHPVFDHEENSSDIHLYLSAEETDEENESNKSSPSVSPYKASRHIKTSSPIPARDDNVFSSVTRDDQVVEDRLTTDTVLNSTFTVPESDSDSNQGEEITDIPNPRGAKHFGSLLPPEEISLMEASLSEFDADVRNTPSRRRKSLLVELGASPLSFRNKINLQNVSKSPKFVISPFKSHRENSDQVCTKMGSMRTRETLKTVDTEAQSIIPVTTNISTGSETTVCSRQMTFQELKDGMCVKSKYVFVLSESDESDLDSQECDNQTAGKASTESIRAGLANEEETEFIRTVQRVKKKLDLDAASTCGSVNQSPVIHVSDSLTSPPYRQQASEPIGSGRKLTKDPNESAITQITNFVVDGSQKADGEDVEDGEILESSLENKMNKSTVKNKNTNKADSHKVGDRKYSQSQSEVIEKRKVVSVSKDGQTSNAKKDSDTDFIKIRNDGSRNGQVSKSEIPLDKPSRIDSRMVGNQFSSSSKCSKPTTERMNDSNRIRKRSRSREPVRDHKYRRNESGQRLSLEVSEKGPRRKRDKRRDERRSREYTGVERDIQYSQERRKYTDRDRDRKYPTPRDTYRDKHPSKENKHRSSSRYE